MKLSDQFSYPFQFWLLCGCSFLFYTAHWMILPELPGYLSAMGGGEYIGFIIGMFTLTAALSRPFSGRLADKVGRIPVIVVGTAISVLCALLYPLVGTVAAFLLLRFVHGFSIGFQPTGTTAFVADIAPGNRRGETIGLFSVMGSMGVAIGPVIGSAVAGAFSVTGMFYLSAGLALASLLLLTRMRETLTDPVPFSFQLLRVRPAELLEPRVWVQALMLFLVMFPNGMVLSLVPDFSDHVGLENKGLYYTFFILASLSVRFFAGRTSDRLGRVPVLRLSFLILIGAMALTAMVASPALLLTAAVLYGLAAGMISPTLYAWTIDLSEDRHRGRALATAYLAVEAGVSGGAFLAGWIYAGQVQHLPTVFWTAAGISLVAFVILQFHRILSRQQVEEGQPGSLRNDQAVVEK